MALSRRSGGRSRLTIALLVLTSLALLTLDFRDAAIVQSARRTAGNVFSPLRGAAETVSEPFSNAWNGITRLRRPPVRERGAAPAASRSSRGARSWRRTPLQQLAELLEQQEHRVGRRHPHDRDAGALGQPVELLPHRRHLQGEQRRDQGRHAGGQRRRARRQGRAGHERPIHGAAHHRPGLRRGHQAARHPRSPAPPAARAAARTSSPTPTSNPTPTTSPSRAPP